MKIVKAVTMLVLSAVLMLAAGCDDGNVAPSPSPTMRPSPSAIVSPSGDPIMSPDMNSPDTSPETSPGTPGTSPGTSPGGTEGSAGQIEGFIDGGTVDPEKVPEVVQAVKDKYPDAEIKSIAYAMYEQQQCYKVMLSGAGEGASDTCYVGADNKLIENGAGTNGGTQS